MLRLFLIGCILLVNCLFVYGQTSETSLDENEYTFSGRISRLNTTAKLARLKTDFINVKFLNRRDRLDFWNESYPNQRCRAWVEGRSNEYLLIKIPDYDKCIKRIHLTTGSLLRLTSEDLKSTIAVAKELVQVLLKKRMAMQAKMQRHQKEIDTYTEKVAAVNSRYQVLKEKLENEWNQELLSLDDDKAKSFTEFKVSEARLYEIETKLEAYRIEDHNLKVDRWSLDPEIYVKK
jgi:hypothetical protein